MQKQKIVPPCIAPVTMHVQTPLLVFLGCFVLLHQYMYLCELCVPSTDNNHCAAIKWFDRVPLSVLHFFAGLLTTSDVMCYELQADPWLRIYLPPREVGTKTQDAEKSENLNVPKVTELLFTYLRERLLLAEMCDRGYRWAPLCTSSDDADILVVENPTSFSDLADAVRTHEWRDSLSAMNAVAIRPSRMNELCDGRIAIRDKEFPERRPFYYTWLHPPPFPMEKNVLLVLEVLCTGTLLLWLASIALEWGKKSTESCIHLAQRRRSVSFDVKKSN
jgi:hypothetical protein